MLFRIRVHPLSQVGALPPRKVRALIEQARTYSFEFLAWRRANVLRKHWLAHNRKVCAQCGRDLKRAYLGVTDRRTFYCEHCQPRYRLAGRHAPLRGPRQRRSAWPSQSAQRRELAKKAQPGTSGSKKARRASR